MKIHTKKKAYRVWLKREAKAGKINNAMGIMVARPTTGNSMIRDYNPTREA